MTNKPTDKHINAISLEDGRPQGSGPEGHQASLLTNETSFEKVEGTTVTDTSVARTEGVINGSLKTEGMVDETTTLTQMLERLVLLGREEIPVSASAGTVLVTYSFPGDVLSNQFISDKVSHFYAIHTDIEVNVKIAVAPMVTVSLAMVLHPRGTPVTGLPRTSYYPHVLLVGPDVKEGTITVPFFNEQEAYEIGGKDVWDVSLVLITPVTASATPTPVSYSAYARMKSPRLMINVAESYADRKISDISSLVRAICEDAKSREEARIKLSSLGVDIHNEGVAKAIADRFRERRYPQQQGEFSDQTGTISSVAHTVGKVAETMMPFVSSIPIIGEVAPAVPWLARAVEKTAGFFGFSRAANMKITKFVSPVAAHQLTQIDGIDNSVTLGLFQDNQIDVSQFPLFQDGDEMCFEALFSRKYIRETILLQGNFFRTIPLAWENDSTSTNVMDAFYLRRYEMRNEFRLVKNAVISGKILVLYDYNNTIDSVDRALQAVDSLTSKIVDITTSSSFLFNIPWTSLSPYEGSIPGSIVMVPFNEFQTSAGAADSINLIRYVSYENVELGRPGNMLPFQLENPPVTTYRVPLYKKARGQGRKNSSDFVVVQQSDTVPCDGNMHTIPAEELPMLKYNPASMADKCIGEMVVSTRSLLKRFSVAFSAPLQFHSNTIIVKESIQLRDTLFHRFNSMWMARTGSLRMKVVVPPNMNLEVELQDHHDKYTGSSGAPFQFYSGSMNSVAEFTVPYYGKNRRSFAEYPWVPVRLTFTRQHELPGVQSTTVYVAAGDDYSGTFVKGKLPSTEQLFFTGFSDGATISPIACKYLRWVDRSGVKTFEYVPPPWGQDGATVYWTSLWKSDDLSILGTLGFDSPLVAFGSGYSGTYSISGAQISSGELGYLEVQESYGSWVNQIPSGGFTSKDFRSTFLWETRPPRVMSPPLYVAPDPSYDTYWFTSCIGYLVSTNPFIMEFGRASGGRGFPIYSIQGGYYQWSYNLPKPVTDPTSFNQTVQICLLIYEEPLNRWVAINRDGTFSEKDYGIVPIDQVEHNNLFGPSFVNSAGVAVPIFSSYWKHSLTPL